MIADTADHAKRPRRKHTAVLREWLPLAGARVADIGCGQGGVARILAREAASVIGIDPQHAALLHAREADDKAEASGPIHYIAAGGETLPLANASMDTAVCFNALHHVPVEHQDAALAEAWRILRPGARLLVVEPIAEGPVFEMVQPVEDETEVRAAAYAALGRAAAQTGWHLMHESEYAAPVRYASFQAFRDNIVAVDPAREPAVERHEAAMRARFEASARQADGAFWFDQPCRLTVLVKASDD
ncbi:class I SAM-dependent methyltransferase [Ferruginivarius sediminum]|uniref:Class I SAM-dependent methyltransferase n=1 Tax=Ferruginivarius sediminum TaxID=2661937 RepID=A0A369T753_9PROT|nr:class I SAM-dependent methyltransferase [Ferruginivarius sediminum]RDD61161.1 class I SAM-dependent methyltransferase [Ferruginivarius sediminum]